MASRRSSKGIAGKLRNAGPPTARQAGIMIIALGIIVLAGWRVTGLAEEFGDVRAQRMELEEKRAVLEQRHRDLEQQAQFVSDPDQLEQELRSRYNYKRPGETVIVVVPPQEEAPEENR
jgi:cell division protein FtsB